MKNKKIAVLLLSLPFMLASCDFGNPADASAHPSVRLNLTQDVELDEPPYDVVRGIGKYDASNVTAGALNAALATKGQELFENTCAACHTLTNEQVVGPGLKDMTKKRTLYWLMNYLANPDPMIDKDPELQEQFKATGMRMANPDLNEEELKAVVEYLRKNDGVK